MATTRACSSDSRGHQVMSKVAAVAFLCLSLLLGALGAGTAAVAQGISNLTISGNQATASLDLPGVGADLTLTFEGAVGLTAASLGLSAQLVNAADPTLLARLPAGGLVTVPGAFPVMISVQPPPAGGLAFSGVYTFDFHVHNLDYSANCPLRLFSASAGGAFSDITTSMGAGSYRVRGTGGSFSDFLVVADVRALSTVVNQKFSVLSNLLTTYGGSIPGALLTSLTNQLQTANSYWQAGDAADAAGAVNGFAATVLNNSGTAIPNVWSAAGGAA